MIPAAAYLRMSSDKQSESVPAQRKAVKELASQHGYRIVEEYVDLGISGDDSERRVEFKRMLADAQRGGFRVVLCWDADRFSRADPIDAAEAIAPLRRAGVTLHTVAQGKVDWSDFAGRIVWSVQQEAKHAYLRDLSRNVVRGQIEAAKKGRWPGGTPPLGYAVKGGCLTLSTDEEAETVRTLFEDYLAGWSLRRLATRFNEKGLRTKRGFLWTMNSVRAILGNEVYCGDLVWGKRCEAKYHRHKAGQVVQAEGHTRRRAGDAVTVRDSHPAIVSRETYRLTQERMESRKVDTSPNHNFLFTGILYCGHCGARMHGTVLYGGIPYYTCRNAPKKLCKRYAVRQDYLVTDAIGPACARFEIPGAAGDVTREVMSLAKSSARAKDIARMRARVSEIDRLLGRAASRIIEVSDAVLPAINREIGRLTTERESLSVRLESAESAKSVGATEADQIGRGYVAAITRLADILRQGKPGGRDGLRSLISRVSITFKSTPWGKLGKHRHVPDSAHVEFLPLNRFVLCGTSSRATQHMVVKVTPGPAPHRCGSRWKNRSA